MTARYQALVDAAPDPLVIVDDSGRMVVVNHQAELLFGYDAGELLGLPIETLLPASLRDSHIQHRRAYFAAPSVRPMGGARTLTALRKDGTELSVEISLGPVQTQEGLRAMATIRDVGVRRELESHLRQREHLAAIGTMAAGVAHEVNNPLASVLINLTLIGEHLQHLDDALPPATLQRDLTPLVEAARDGAERVRKIVRGLRAFTREADQRGPVDAQGVLDAALQVTFNEIRHRARLERYAGALPLVLADEARLGQVFVNLLLNAAQAIPEGNAEANVVRVSTSTLADGRAEIVVSDSGSGIDPEVRARLFEPFVTTKRIGTATGLGLFTCHGIVTGLGGEILVESGTGNGSTFRVRLPAAKAATASAAPEGRRAPRGRVLVIDDDPLVGDSFGRVLSDHDVTVTRDARDGLAAIHNAAPFDAILCDLMMPEVTGMDLFETLTGERPDTARDLIFVTGGAFTDRARSFLEEVSNERLEKPVDATTLRALVRRRVEQRRRAGQ